MAAVQIQFRQLLYNMVSRIATRSQTEPGYLDEVIHQAYRKFCLEPEWAGWGGGISDYKVFLGARKLNFVTSTCFRQVNR